MEFFAIKFWVIFQILVDGVLLCLIIYFLKNFRGDISQKVSRDLIGRSIGMLEPVLKDADQTAKAFEKQLVEKHRLIHQLNERLDSRIISLNLLLNRADACLVVETPAAAGSRKDICDQQRAVLDLFNKGLDAETVAEKLSLPLGEVEMIFSLKRKFLKMEQHISDAEGTV